MGFLFNICFWMIFAIVAMVFLFYLPIITMLVLGGLIALSVGLTVLAYKIDKK